MKFYDKSKMSIFWWKFNFKGSKEIIFRMGHVTIGLHMLHSVNFWLDLKIESKNIRIFQIVDSTSKTDKNIEISFFKNIKKWTCEADFQGWKKVIFITKCGDIWKFNFKLKITSKKYNRNFVNIREWYLRGNFTSDKSVPVRPRAW